MSLKDLLVHVDHGVHNAARLDAAISLAQNHDAHLTGLYALAQPHIPGFVRAEISEEILVRQAEAVLKAAQDAEADFNERVDRAGVRGEWRAVEGKAEPLLQLHGRYADVVVVGQRDPDTDDVSTDADLTDRLVLSVGRPVLIIPSAGTFPDIGQRVVVAWDASRLAARAIADAIPFLVNAKKVTVLAINPQGGEDGHGDIPSADICLHLARHGVRADAEHVFADDIGAGDMLLSRIADHGADLLVMGAYGHARWRELVLGGMTRHILTHMTVPTLMSH